MSSAIAYQKSTSSLNKVLPSNQYQLILFPEGLSHPLILVHDMDSMETSKEFYTAMLVFRLHHAPCLNSVCLSPVAEAPSSPDLVGDLTDSPYFGDFRSAVYV